VFDLMHLDDRSLLDLAYIQRREVLDNLALAGRNVRTPPWFSDSGQEVLAASVEQELEGVIAKRLQSRYHPARRTGDWLKIKNVRHQEVVVGGWRPGKGRRADLIGSLLVCVPGERSLEYVGTGFTHTMLRDIAAQLQPLERQTSPFGTDVPLSHARDAH
jgi:bifunctional non-homologous end joining protein LigD